MENYFYTHLHSHDYINDFILFNILNGALKL